MDLTLAVGGIQQSQKIGTAQQQLDKHKADSEDEGATMEFTFVVGSGLNRDAGKRRESGSSLSNYEDMDFTVARGRILQSITERTESVDDNTVGMDMTTAIGAILPQQLRPSNTAQAKVLMEREADNGQLSASSLYEVAQKTPELKQPAEARVSEHVRTGTSDSGSPSVLLSEGRGSRRRDIKRGTSVTPSRTTPQSTPLNKPTTPSKQLTSKVAKPITPGKTPPAKNISMRTGSPKKLFELETKQTVPSSVVKAGSTLNKQDAADNSIAKSKVVLKPSSRRSSGLGVDRTGIGSPRVTELLDRRGSIFSNTEAFVVHNQPQANVHFADPQVMEQEVDQERMQDQRRESGLQILQQEADEQDLEVHKDATTNLKDKIESLTPQKKKGKLNGRKSLHVGAAKGLLGKRSAELDNNEDDEDTTPKRLKGMESSPVKKVKLPAPPTKSATTGRVTRSSRVSLGETEVNAHLSTPNGNVPRMKGSRVTTPKDQPRFKDAGNDVSPAKAALFSISQTEHGAAAAFEPPQGEDHVHLQDFLNLTSIRFMELTTTKRRHTIAPNASLDSDGKSLNDGDNGAVPAGIGSDLESCVVAGACTLPVLDLYQHVRTPPRYWSFWLTLKLVLP